MLSHLYKQQQEPLSLWHVLALVIPNCYNIVIMPTFVYDDLIYYTYRNIA